MSIVPKVFMSRKSHVFEAVGIGTVIVSLLFVAVELHQNTKAVHGQTNQAIADNVNALYLAIATDNELSAAWHKLLNNVPSSQLSNEEKIILEMALLSGFRRVENIWYQVEEGLIEERALTRIGYLPYTKVFATETWKKYRNGFDPMFLQYFELQVSLASQG